MADFLILGQELLAGSYGRGELYLELRETEILKLKGYISYFPEAEGDFGQKSYGRSKLEKVTDGPTSQLPWGQTGQIRIRPRF